MTVTKKNRSGISRVFLICGVTLALYTSCNASTNPDEAKDSLQNTSRDAVDAPVVADSAIAEKQGNESPKPIPEKAVTRAAAPDSVNKPADRARKSATQQGLVISVKEFGAKGDGLTDDTKAIQAALDKAAESGGGTVIIPPSGGNYIVSNTIYVGSNTTLKWTGKNYLKLTAPSYAGGVLGAKSVIDPIVCNNIKIINPYIDANRITGDKYGENGIGFAYCRNVEVSGGVVKGARRVNVSGGKGIHFETGVSNCVIRNTVVEDSDFAYGTAGVPGNDKFGRARIGTNIQFLNVTARNCGRFLWLTCTMSPPPVDRNITNCLIDGFKAYNCGKMDGLISVDRYSYAVIRNGVVQNSADYGPIEAIIRGRGAHITLDNIQFKGNTVSVASSRVIPKGGVTIKAENWKISNIQQTGDIDYISTGDNTGDWKNPDFKSIRHGKLKKSVTDFNSRQLEPLLKKME